jgi:hypothetical protein
MGAWCQVLAARFIGRWGRSDAVLLLAVDRAYTRIHVEHDASPRLPDALEITYKSAWFLSHRIREASC